MTSEPMPVSVMQDMSLTLDAFLGGRLHIYQPAKGQRSGTDAVLLAASIAAKPGQSTLEAGIGAGVVSLCVQKRVGNLLMTGLELQENMGELARRNMAHNHFQDDVTIITGDVTASGNAWQAMGLTQDSFDHSFANPPFYHDDDTRKPDDKGKAAAHMHQRGALERWVRFLVAHTKPKGTVTLIHTPDMLGALLGYLDKRIGDIRVFPFFAKDKSSATRVLVQGIKGSKAPLRIEAGLVLHNPDGTFSDRAHRIFRDGQALWDV